MYCKKCGKEITGNEAKCPDCGEALVDVADNTKKEKNPVTKKWWFWVLIVAAALIVISSVFCCGIGAGSDSGETGTNAKDEQNATSSAQIDADEPDATDVIADIGAEEVSTTEESKDDGFLRVGDTLDDNGLKITYVSAEKWTGYNQYMEPKDGNIIIKLYFDAENESSVDRFISLYDFLCYADGSATDMYYSGADDLSLTLSKGRSGSGAVYFEVPADAEVVEVEYEVNIWTDRKAVFLVELA